MIYFTADVTNIHSSLHLSLVFDAFVPRVFVTSKLMIHLQLAHQNSRVLPFDVLDQEVIFLATALGTAALPVSSSVHHRTDAFQELIGGLP